MDQSARRRVVITGLGVVSPAGNELNEFWGALMAGKCFIRPLNRSMLPGLPELYGAEVELPDQEELRYGEAVRGSRERCGLLALAAARRALDDARPAREALQEMGVVLGTTLGEERQVGDLNDRFCELGENSIEPDFLLRSDNHSLAALVARQNGLLGPVMLNATACSSGSAATAWAYDLIASGACDAMLAGGVDTLTRVTYAGFSRMGALSKSVCRPFHKHRDGVSFSEGAGVLMLEEREQALQRGARIYAELAGYGISNDAYHLTAPEQNGDGFVRAIKQALASTDTALDQVDYVSAHGTGTAYNDLGESTAIKAVFKERASSLPVSSIKSMIGHSNGAASAIESVACTLALVHQAIPPTANLSEPDPALGLDFVPNKGRHTRLRTCLNLAAGFGGFNVCVVLKEAL